VSGEPGATVDIFTEPERHDFYSVLRQLETQFAYQPRIGDSASRRQEFVDLGQDPYFAFPASNVTAARRKPDGRIQILSQFLGLLGPQGALPLALNLEAFHFLRANDDAFARFLDIFNDRFLQLFFRAWGDARPIVHHDRPSADRFETYVGANAGLGSEVYRDLDSVPDIAKIGFAGLMAPAAKSASRLRDLIAGLFGVKVEVEEFVGMRLMFEPDQRSMVGKANASLGRDMLLGAGVYSVQDKFRLRIYVVSLAHYREFLPTGKLARLLADMVFFYAGSEMEWDVELALPAGEAEPMRLGKSGQLGWTTWMAPNWADDKSAIRTDARFDLTSRFG
jgi:type VI secretion system protein ImpH